MDRKRLRARPTRRGVRARRPRNFSWLDEFVAGSAMPSSPEEVVWLLGVGVRAVVSLDPNLPPDVAETIREVGLEHHVVPVEDFSAPTVRQLDLITGILEGHASSGERVVVHCLMGCGRTGTALAAYLVRRGIPPDEAIYRVRSLRPCSLENSAQEEAVRWFGRFLESSGRRLRL